MSPDERVRAEERALAARQGDAAGWARLSHEYERFGRRDDAARAALFARRVAPGAAEHLDRLRELGWADGLWPSERGDAGNRGVSPLEGPDEGVLRWRAVLPRVAVGRPVIDLEGRAVTRAQHGGLMRARPDGALGFLGGSSVVPLVLRGGEPCEYDLQCASLVTASTERTPQHVVARGGDGWAYAHGASGLVALTPDGDVRWRASGVFFDVATGAGGVLLAIVGQGLQLRARALDARTGAVAWQGPVHARSRSTELRVWAVACDDGSWLCALPGAIVSHEADGLERWRRKLAHPVDAPAVAGGVAVLTTGLSVEQLDLATGAVRWRRELRSGRSAAFDARGIAYVSTYDQRLVGLRPDGSTHCQVTIKGAATPSAPSIGWDRTAYVTAGKALVAIR